MRVRHTWTVLAATAATSIALAPAASATASPPGIPSTSTALSQLAALPVETEGSMTGYDRDEFDHWITRDGCTTRETVLARDGDDVTVGSDCYPDSGSWFSEYDGQTLSEAPDLDIDHVVPLAEAWRSGADSWSDQEREDFANDLEGPQLIAVSASSNRSKGDQDPSTWWPTRTSYRCTYAKMWVATKYRWGLALQSAEKTALANRLESC
ncbi:HNH endonuclease family protein [Janibacter anophelis]|uniref:HNH endonuclease family protein n=1 Tax=Janibacter anophelis TaxID=319054 RepID=UPI000DEF4CC9|nr:HNH endonuclease family protein [Janibacter anophelis]